MSESAFNKRRRGEVPFTAAEFVRLSDRFALPTSVAALRGVEARVEVPHPAGMFEDDGFLHRLHRIREAVEAGSPDAEERAELLVSTTDLPLLRLLSSGPLMKMKLFFFGSTTSTSGLPEHQLILGEGQIIAPQVLELVAAYRAADSREVWGERPLRSLCQQIHYLVRHRCISRADVSVLFSELERLVERLLADITEGVKVEGGGRIQLWREDLVSYSPMYAVLAPSHRIAFFTHDPPQFLTTEDAIGVRAISNAIEHRLSRGQRIGPGGRIATRTFREGLLKTIEKGRHITETLFESQDW